MDTKEKILEALNNNQNPYHLFKDPLPVTRALMELKNEGLVDFDDGEKKLMCDGVIVFLHVRLRPGAQG